MLTKMPLAVIVRSNLLADLQCAVNPAQLVSDNEDQAVGAVAGVCGYPEVVLAVGIICFFLLAILALFTQSQATASISRHYFASIPACKTLLYTRSDLSLRGGLELPPNAS